MVKKQWKSEIVSVLDCIQNEVQETVGLTLKKLMKITKER